MANYLEQVVIFSDAKPSYIVSRRRPWLGTIRSRRGGSGHGHAKWCCKRDLPMGTRTLRYARECAGRYSCVQEIARRSSATSGPRSKFSCLGNCEILLPRLLPRRPTLKKAFTGTVGSCDRLRPSLYLPQGASRLEICRSVLRLRRTSGPIDSVHAISEKTRHGL